MVIFNEKKVKKYRCYGCSISRQSVYIKPQVIKEGYLQCPKCGSTHVVPIYRKK